MSENKSSCVKCKGLGYLPTESGNRLCTCRVVESLKLAMKHSPSIAMAKTEKKIPIDRFTDNQVISVANLDSLYSILKVYFTKGFLMGEYKSVEVIDQSTLIEAYFNNNNLYSMGSIKEVEFLVLILEEGTNHKMLTDAIKAVVTYRLNILKKPTWIGFSSFNARNISSITGLSEFVRYLKNSGFSFISTKVKT